ncbi:MAG: DUF2142 domain-containing protein [Candidatus Promineofilum sp.]|nr:DUF2142 domain-containing protein [Promineifilum sp.]
MLHSTTGHWPLVTILIAFLLLGLAYSAINPLHEATDELRHYRFIQHLIQRRALPVQGETSGLACTIQGHHPPLFYASAALLTFGIDTGRDVCAEPPTNPFWAYRYWEVGRDNKNQYLHGPDEAFPWRGEALAAHLARLVNLLFGALTVGLTWATARLMWPGRPALAAGSAAFVAFNPMFLYMAAAINNDVAAAAAGAAITYACVRLLLDGRGLRRQWGVALGLLYAAALLSKFNLAAIIVVIEAAVTWVAWRRGQWRQWLIVNGLIVGVTALLAGWWFARNQLLYGEPTGIEQLTQLWGVRDPRDSFGLAVSELPYAWTSLWGRFGYGQIPLPPAVYIGLFVVLLLSIGGYLFAFLRHLRPPRPSGEGSALPLPVGEGWGEGSALRAVPFASEDANSARVTRHPHPPRATRHPPRATCPTPPPRPQRRHLLRRPLQLPAGQPRRADGALLLPRAAGVGHFDVLWANAMGEGARFQGPGSRGRDFFPGPWPLAPGPYPRLGRQPRNACLVPRGPLWLSGPGLCPAGGLERRGYAAQPGGRALRHAGGAARLLVRPGDGATRRADQHRTVLGSDRPAAGRLPAVRPPGGRGDGRARRPARHPPRPGQLPQQPVAAGRPLRGAAQPVRAGDGLRAGGGRVARRPLRGGRLPAGPHRRRDGGRVGRQLRPRPGRPGPGRCQCSAAQRRRLPLRGSPPSAGLQL